MPFFLLKNESAKMVHEIQHYSFLYAFLVHKWGFWKKIIMIDKFYCTNRGLNLSQNSSSTSISSLYLPFSRNTSRINEKISCIRCFQCKNIFNFVLNFYTWLFFFLNFVIFQKIKKIREWKIQPPQVKTLENLLQQLMFIPSTTSHPRKPQPLKKWKIRHHTFHHIQNDIIGIKKIYKDV